MNIAYVSADHGIPVFGGKGASIHIQEMVKALCLLDHRVHVMTARVGGTCDDFPAQVTKIRPRPQSVDNIDIDTVTADQDRLCKERRYLAIGQTMLEAIKQQHAKTPFDFVYERYSLWSVAGVRAARALGIPCMIEVNAPLMIEQRQYRKLMLIREAEAVEREVMQEADCIAAVSSQVAAYAIEKGAPAERVIVQPNGVNPNRFSPAVVPVCLAGLDDGPIIGFSGSLKPWHGLEDLLDAFAIVRATHRNCCLLIVGDGPLRPWIDGYVRGADLVDSVMITGWQPHEQLPAYIQCMDIACAPYPQIEGFYFSPLKLSEYMACGRPVVASGIGQILDLIEDGHNGLLSRPGDAKHLAKQITTLLDNPALGQRLGRSAVRSMSERTWQHNARCAVSFAEGAAARSLRELAGK